MAFIKPSITSNQSSSSKRTTLGLFIGATEAEGETIIGQGLKEYYEDYLHIDDAFLSGKFIISGRKGVGKSAYVKHLLLNSSIENGLLCSVIKYNTKTLEKIIQEIPNDISNKFCVVYEWIILSEMVKLLLKNTNAAFSDGYDAIRKFATKNSGVMDITKWMTVSESNSKALEVSFYELVKYFPAKFGMHVDRSSCRAPFYKYIPALRDIVTKMLAYDVNKDVNYVVIFDDLDIGFSLNEDTHKAELMDLIRTARDYNTCYFPNQNSRVLLMLRDDIARQLDGIASDTNKIFSSYEYKLNWYDSDKNLSDEKSLLRSFINRRISIGLDKLGIKYDASDAWSSLVENDASDYYPRRTAFKFILDCTFYRPRDLVALFKDIGRCNYTIPISPDNIKKLVKKYAIWNASEIKDELSNIFNSTKERDRVFELLRQIAESKDALSYYDIVSLIQRLQLREDTFEILLDYNLIVPMDNQDRQYYSYREKNRLDDEKNYKYNLPKALYIYFKPHSL